MPFFKTTSVFNKNFTVFFTEDYKVIIFPVFFEEINFVFFDRFFPARNWKPYLIFFAHLVLPIISLLKEKAPFAECFFTFIFLFFYL